MFHTGVRATGCNQHTTNSFPLTQTLDASIEELAIISAKNQRSQAEARQGKGREAKWKNVEHAREKEKIGGTAGNESCTSMIRTPLSKVRRLKFFPAPDAVHF